VPQLEGAKRGEPKTFDLTFPADHQVEAIRGKTAAFTATVNEIRIKQQPAIDDALAQAVGAGSLAELKDKTRADLLRAAENRAELSQRDALLDRLIEKNPFEIPKSLVDAGVRVLLESALGMFARQGLDPRNLPVDWGQIQNDLRPRAEREVRGTLILEAVAKQEKIEVTDADVEAQLEKLAAGSGAPLSTVRKQYKTEDALKKLKERVLEDKALALVKNAATFEEPKP
jgi:trigger factor